MVTTSTPDAPLARATIVVRRRRQGAKPDLGLASRAGEAPPPPVKWGQRGEPAPTRTILCIEDSPILLKLLGRQLEHLLGCRVMLAETVEKAVVMLLRERPDLIVTDLMMPDLDGTDLLAILQARPDWRSIPVIVHSVVEDLDRVRALIDSGVRDYLLKPFNAGVAIPRLKRSLATLPRVPTGGDRERVTHAPGTVPLVFVAPRKALWERVRAALDPLYGLVSVSTVPEAVAAAIEVRPWLTLVTGDAGPWDSAKTMRSLLGLKTLGRSRVAPLPRGDRGDPVVLEAVKRELKSSPFSMSADGRHATIAIEDTFTASCVGALRRLVEQAAERGVVRFVFDVPFHALEQQAVAALQELTHVVGEPD